MTATPSLRTQLWRRWDFSVETLGADRFVRLFDLQILDLMVPGFSFCGITGVSCLLPSLLHWPTDRPGRGGGDWVGVFRSNTSSTDCNRKRECCNKRCVGYKTIPAATVVYFRPFVVFFCTGAGFSWYTTTASQIPRKITDVWRQQSAIQRFISSQYCAD